MTNISLNKAGCLPRRNCCGFSVECPSESLKIHKTSHTESQFELTPSGILHWKVLPGCSISGMCERYHMVILKNIDEDIAGDNYQEKVISYLGKGGHPILKAMKADISPRALCERHLLLGFWQTWFSLTLGILCTKPEVRRNFC